MLRLGEAGPPVIFLQIEELQSHKSNFFFRCDICPEHVCRSSLLLSAHKVLPPSWCSLDLMPATMYLRCCTVPTLPSWAPLPLFTLPLETVSSHSVGWIHLEMGVCRLLARVTGTWETRGAASCITANCHVATPRLVWCGTYPTLGPGHFRLSAAPTERQASTLRRPSSKTSPIGLERAFPPLHRAVCRQSLAGHQACFTVQTIGGVAVA